MLGRVREKRYICSVSNDTSTVYSMVPIRRILFAVLLLFAGLGCGQKAAAQTQVLSHADGTCPDANHPHMIDLGLPSGTKWACCNVGASKPEQYGNYYAWGETLPKEVYEWDTYAYGSSWDNVVDIGSDIAATGYDAATTNWGAPWQMPTIQQCIELINSCSSEWTTQDGVYGRVFTGPNGGTIFLPATGYRWGTKLDDAGSEGNYWSSTVTENDLSLARILCFFPGNVRASYVYRGRHSGRSVRPVR